MLDTQTSKEINSNRINHTSIEGSSSVEYKGGRKLKNQEKAKEGTKVTFIALSH